jgi:hypothetical protein
MASPNMIRGALAIRAEPVLNRKSPASAGKRTRPLSPGQRLLVIVGLASSLWIALIAGAMALS